MTRGAGGASAPPPTWSAAPSPTLEAELEPLDAVLLDPAAYANVGSGGLQPALVRGTLAVDPEAPIAVAVNGVVAATSRSYLDGGSEVLFGVMVDETAAAARPQRDHRLRHRPGYWVIWSNDAVSPVADDSANCSSHAFAFSSPDASTIFRGMAGNE